jgi:predicted glycogen debranching enzyme
MYWAIQQYLAAGGRRESVREQLWAVMKQGIRHFAEGHEEDAWMAANGLLHCGSRDTQLTWMDATVHEQPVTPRWGYAVEINALWYNALQFCAELAAEFGDRDYQAPMAGETLAVAFVETFWLTEKGYLADVVNDDGVDAALRPNQIFAVSMPHSPLPKDKMAAVVEAVQKHLLTPVGLRTLAPGDPAYQGRYGGGSEMRDGAYHQGTVWPWPFGGFAEAYLKVHDFSPAARRQVRKWLRGWLPHLNEAGLGTVSEIFDGDPPHRPAGCIAQAWSIAELLRSAVVAGLRPTMFGDLVCGF